MPSVIDVDQVCRDVIDVGSPAHAELVATFGRGIIDDGRLDRAALARVVFADPAALAALTALSHPAANHVMQAEVEALADDSVVVLDMAVLAEYPGLGRWPGGGYDTVVVVVADESVRLRRLMDQRGLSEADARARMANQLPDEERSKLAHHVLDNSSTAEALASSVDALLPHLGLARPAPSPPHRLYGDLAPWWPLISPVAEYADEAAFAASLLRLADGPVREVLELGSGGGNNAFHLCSEFDLTLVDLSDAMLDVSRRLNPTCRHVPGDMRTVRLDQTFDAVFVHDAIDYMLTIDDLARALRTAWEHCRSGGVVVVIPDATTETYEDGDGLDGSDGTDGRAVRYMTWSWDPDPTDTWTATEYVFVLRDAHGSISTVHDTHRTGLFPRATWLAVLADIGFDPRLVPEITTENRPPRDCFVARRPRS